MTYTSFLPGIEHSIGDTVQFCVLFRRQKIMTWSWGGITWTEMSTKSPILQIVLFSDVVWRRGRRRVDVSCTTMFRAIYQTRQAAWSWHREVSAAEFKLTKNSGVTQQSFMWERPAPEVKSLFSLTIVTGPIVFDMKKLPIHDIFQSFS